MKLKNKALLVHLGIKAWSPSKIDRAESKALRAAHGTARNMAKVSKKLMDSQNLKDILFIRGQARNEHYKQTLPWKDGDLRILPTLNFLPYQTAMNGYKAQFDAAVSKFVNEFNTDAAAAAVYLGGLYKASDYPSPAAIASRFEFTLAVYAISDETDFRVDLAETEIKAIQQNAETMIRESVKGAVRESWERIADAVSHVEERLSNPDNRFHDTLISNLKDLAETLPRLNISQDPNLDAMAKAIQERLLKHTADTLRTDKDARAETAKAASDIAAKVKAEQEKIDTLDALGAYRS